MQARAYDLMAALEAEHWWYRGRRALLARLLARVPLGPRARLLEVGCGTGGNLALLAAHGTAFGVEPEPAARARLAGRTDVAIAAARTEELPFRERSFDAVAALDVLEHVHDDLAALDEMRRVLRPGGRLVVFVPAYGWLWGHEDVLSRHLRRYTAAQLRRLLEAARFGIEHVAYATTVLFPLVAAVKLAKRALVRASRPVSDVESIPPWPFNDLLSVVAEADAEVASSFETPFGASVIALARRRG